MRASAYGLDSPRSETYTPPPCAADPTGWEVPTGKVLMTEPRVERAVEGCRTCPLLRTCATTALRRPPEHHVVQGGWIWGYGKRQTLGQYRLWLRG